MEHAFYAEYGSGHPVMPIKGYDALPGLSQRWITNIILTEKGPGMPADIYWTLWCSIGHKVS